MAFPRPVWFGFGFSLVFSPHWPPADKWNGVLGGYQNVHFLCSKNLSYASLPTYCHLESRGLVQTKEGKGVPTDNAIYDRHSASMYGWPRLCHTDVDICKGSLRPSFHHRQLKAHPNFRAVRPRCGSPQGTGSRMHLN